MWIVRNKEAVCCRLFIHKPVRYERTSVWIDGKNATNEFGLQLDCDMYPDVKWEDDPLNVDFVSFQELSETQKELKNVYLELQNIQTKEIRNLTQVFRGVQLEEVSEALNDIEGRIHSKYEMIGDPSCSQNCRAVSIANDHHTLSDNTLREYIDNDKVVATIYIRRNDFNTVDILVCDLGDEYYTL